MKEEKILQMLAQPDKQREAFGTTVCNFVERYLLELDLPIMPEIGKQDRMNIDRVTISGHADVAALCADTTVSIHTQVIYEKGYTMSWQREGRQLCSITFPVEYNLLFGVDMEERERRLPLELARYSTAPQPQLPLCDSLPPMQLRKSWNDNYYTLHAGHYLLESLSANSYYTKDTLGCLQPIFSQLLPVESLANLFVIGTIEGDFRRTDISFFQFIDDPVFDIRHFRFHTEIITYDQIIIMIIKKGQIVRLRCFRKAEDKCSDPQSDLLFCADPVTFQFFHFKGKIRISDLKINIFPDVKSFFVQVELYHFEGIAFLTAFTDIFIKFIIYS